MKYGDSGPVALVGLTPLTQVRMVPGDQARLLGPACGGLG